MHWSDFSTLELILALARRTEAARLLILGTYRPGEMVGSYHPLRTMKPELELHRYCHELRLKLLTEADVAAYLDERFVDDHAAPLVAGLASLIHERTEGNPLFMVSMVDYLLEQEWASDPAKIEVPGNISQMIERNLERIKPDEQRILEAASVAGAEFSAAAVAAALQSHVREVEDCCSRLSRQEQFISVDGICEWPDGTVASKYRFQHSLYADALYGRIPAGYRLELHRRIGEREEQAHGECASEIAVELAHHYSRANDRNKAIEYLQLAGERAMGRCAMGEAEGHYANALALLSKLPETAERNRRELELQLAIGRARIAIKGWAAPAVENAYIRGGKLFEEQGDTAQLFSVLYGKWVSHLVRLDIREAYQIGEELMFQAENAGDPKLLLQAHHALGNTLCQMGRFHLARQHLEKAVSLCNGRRARPLSVDLEVASRSYLSWTLWFLGYPDQALEMSYKAVQVARELSDPFSLLLAEIFLCDLQQHRRDERAVLETAESLSAICAEHGFLFGEASATLRRGAVMVEDGRGEEGLEQIQQGLAAHRATGAKVDRPEFLCWLAKGYCATGRLDEALDTINDALKVSEQHEYLLLMAEMYRLKGDFLLHQGDSAPQKLTPVLSEE